MRIAVIVSRFARRLELSEIRPTLTSQFIDHQVRFWSVASTEETFRRTHESVRWGADVVVAVGGDGTVNGVIRGIAGTATLLGIIPAGTANDLAHQLRIPCTLDNCCNTILRGNTRQIDLVQVNGSLLATVGGIGLPAETVSIADSMRIGGNTSRLMARFASDKIYTAAVAPALLRLTRNPISVRTTVTGASWTSRIISLTVANQPFLGKRFYVSPDAANDNGCLEVMGIVDGGLCRNVRAVLSTLVPQSSSIFNIFRMKTSQIELDVDREMPFAGDGEIIDIASRFEISTLPRALTVIVPPPFRNLPVVSALLADSR